MANINDIDEYDLAAFFDMAEHYDISHLELEHGYGSSFESSSNTDSKYSEQIMLAVPSPLGSVVFGALIYIISLVITGYIIVQAMETVSFILSPHTGIAWKVGWIMFLILVGIFTSTLLSLNFEGEIGIGQPQVPMWL
jgi:hypothetical protein